MNSNQVADRARFIKAYNIYRQRSFDEAVTLPKVKELAVRLDVKLPSYGLPELPVSSEGEDETNLG